MDASRFRDPQLRLRHLADEPILVVCPRCSRRASVTRERLTCAGLRNPLGMPLVARLPAAKHRDEVLRTIAKLRATLS
ncbi:hypothetical protein [Amycolatopsis sp. NPDC102389]|uniref:hypothetical protein n=1 Tax=Amycolatopsis sp. NPDC102389 TaxID=3363941 RepID=UPI00381A787A